MHQLHHHAPTFVTNGTADVSRTVSIEEEDTAGNISGISSLTFHARYAGAGHAGRAGTGQRHRHGRRQDHQQPDDRLPDARRGDVLLYSLDAARTRRSRRRH